MLTGKQRSYLKSLAHNMDPIIQVGKNGVTENFIKQIDELLEARELIKIKNLENSMITNKDIFDLICETLNIEFVQSIGSKLIIYRESEENKKIKLP